MGRVRCSFLIKLHCAVATQHVPHREEANARRPPRGRCIHQQGRSGLQLAELKIEIESDPSLSEKYASRMAELEKNLQFCKERKKYYRDCHLQLQGNPKKMIVTADFTAAQTGMQDKFSNFVVVVCTDGPLYVPLTLVNESIEPEKPQSKKRAVEKPVIEKKSRRKKMEIAESGVPGRKLLPSFAQEKAKFTKKVQPLIRDDSNVYKPSSTVFHFVISTASTSGTESARMVATMGVVTKPCCYCLA